jgi:hypothetical protein
MSSRIVHPFRAVRTRGGLAASFAFDRAIETSAQQVRAAAGGKMSIPLLFFERAKSLAGAFQITICAIEKPSWCSGDSTPQ